jgi:hypothetical protein
MNTNKSFQKSKLDFARIIAGSRFSSRLRRAPVKISAGAGRLPDDFAPCRKAAGGSLRSAGYFLR